MITVRAAAPIGQAGIEHFRIAVILLEVIATRTRLAQRSMHAALARTMMALEATGWIDAFVAEIGRATLGVGSLRGGRLSATAAIGNRLNCGGEGGRGQSARYSVDSWHYVPIDMAHVSSVAHSLNGSRPTSPSVWAHSGSVMESQ